MTGRPFVNRDGVLMTIATSDKLDELIEQETDSRAGYASDPMPGPLERLSIAAAELRAEIKDAVLDGVGWAWSKVGNWLRKERP